MSKDTQNSLVDFDMCLALAQKAINSQMTAAWESWIARSEFSSIGEMKDFALVKIFPLKKDGKPSQYGLEAEFAPLTVSFYVPSGKLGQVEVTLHLQSGTVTYFDEEEEEKGSYDFKNWSVSFLTDLDKKPCDLKMLEQIDPSVRGSAEEVIKQSGLPDSVFSIEYLFMKFTQVNLLLSDNKNIHIPDDVPKAVRTKALTSLNNLLQVGAGGAGDFMLGTVVRRSKEKSKEAILPTFALTDFIFNVKADSVPEASTLSYLGMFARRPLPANLDTARIALQDNWVRPEMIDGTQGSISGVMAISKQVFMEKYLIQALSQSLQGETLESSGLTWTFKRQEQIPEVSQREACIIPPFYMYCHYDTARDYSLKLEIQPGTNRITLSGQINSHAIYDGYTPDRGPLGGKEHVSWIHYRGYSDISGSVTLQGEGIGEKFKLNPKLDFSISQVKVTEAETKGLADVTEFFAGVLDTLGIIDGTPAEALANMQQSILDGLKNALESEFNNLKLDLSQHAFIPPGGGVFTFQNPRFSNTGDLIFDAIYQAP
ncbi:MAG: hypothetical protein HC836_04305 [Richelia sp. RM2_1_2]|nr:hypothetical protein [Richelia sp. SM1_7_0]NJN08293.1 hypothetical protein [Richelia sp. RM1_1_1]NJO26369.1 hypothetical protein [Richelia sp. SL_2_1]NJO57617.1 hypothetical protein [Richelia sp. RM2_1_2]